MSELVANAQDATGGEPVVIEADDVTSSTSDKPETTFEETEGHDADTEQTQTYLTQAEAKRLIDEAVKEAEGRTRSYADSHRLSLQKAVQEVRNYVKASEKLGKPISPQDQEAMETQAIRKALADDAEQSKDANLTGSQLSAKYAQDIIAPHDIRMQERFGVGMEATDPEVQGIRFTGNASIDLEQITQAYQAKKERLENSKSQDQKSKDDPKSAVRSKQTQGSPNSKQALLAELTQLQSKKVTPQRMQRRKEILEKLKAYD